MHFLGHLWATTTYLVSLLTLSPVNEPAIDQQAPLKAIDPVKSHFSEHQPIVALPVSHHDDVHGEAIPGPVFKPPSGQQSGPGSDFKCDYSRMVGWTYCSEPQDRGCWLKRGEGVRPEDRFDITTPYETDTPSGVTRRYKIELTDDFLNADGMYLNEAKLFNGQYPGPWIQACWGDQVIVEVVNRLKLNGTSIHWHGIRQLNTMHMDGVNGVTQCPIAPGESFTYSWKALQYGSSWYHSHYSVQYADGAHGPLTLHGPTSSDYDEAKLPILMTDWGHNSAFEAIWTGIDAPSILLNGIGNVTRYNNSNQNTAEVPRIYSTQVAKGKSYLLRIINTSFESTFIFSIDYHNLTVVQADFVPIKPYVTQSVLVGIGQRCHVIINANDPAGEDSTDSPSNYWIRTWRAHCFHFPGNHSDDYEKTGILGYGDSPPEVGDVVHEKPWPIDFNCTDENATSLQPVVSWEKITPPANDPLGKIGENLTVQFTPATAPNKPAPDLFPLAFASMGGDDFNPLQINFGDPIFLHLNYTGQWPPLWVVFPEDYTSNDFVWLVIKGPRTTCDTPGKCSNPGGANAHPIHLHGHDFAILEQNYVDEFPTNMSNLNLIDPPRRDVVLLPDHGYVVIAFKTDNPGNWLMHCHIAFHAAGGLAMQIIERQQDAAAIWPSLKESPALENAQKTCNSWNKWWGDCNNWWPGDGSSCPLGEDEFAPDSGI